MSLTETRDGWTDLVLRTIDFPLLVVDEEGVVVEYDTQMADLIDVPRAEALGSGELGRLAYGKPGKLTMAEKVADAPLAAHEEYGLDLADEEYALLRGLDGPVYEDRSTTETGQDLWFIATPLYRDGEFVGVLELVQDDADSARRQTELEALMGEITDTLAAFQRGEFGARADFATGDSVLDPELLALVEYVNDVGAAIQRMTGGFQQDLEELSTSLVRARDLAAEIEDSAADQENTFEDVQSDLEEFSTRMEELASNSRAVAASIQDARTAGESGLDAIEDASDSSATVRATAAELVDTVEKLGDRMTDIGDVADIIADVADQTNMLALNANIEAARAGEKGEGFAVVADEVKQLADETQAHTDRIADQIGDLRTQVDETVGMARDASEHVERSNERVTEAASAFETVAEEIETATTGIDRIATTNDHQAETIDRITSTVDDAVETATENRARSEEISRHLR
jgi:methyl-accepting chemotaxis protein